MAYDRVRMKVKAKKENKKKADKAAKASEETISGSEATSELNEPRWSVVTFESCAASNLTYAAAAENIKNLQAKKISGLCIVTDETARRIAVK